MINNKLINSMNKHIHDNFWLYIITLLFTCTGIVLGIYAVKYLDIADKNEMMTFLSTFTSNVSAYDINHKAIFLESIKNNIPLIVGIWFLGLTIVGIPVILIIDVVKGFTVGFSISFMINSLGLKGIWVSLLGILPQNIIYIPCVIVSSVLAIEYSLLLIKSKGIRKYADNRIGSAGIYSIIFMLVILFMSIGFLIDIYITPGLMKVILARLGSGVA
jgi:stage II sporulation protein M